MGQSARVTGFGSCLSQYGAGPARRTRERASAQRASAVQVPRPLRRAAGSGAHHRAVRARRHVRPGRGRPCVVRRRARRAGGALRRCALDGRRARRRRLSGTAASAGVLLAAAVRSLRPSSPPLPAAGSPALSRSPAPCWRPAPPLELTPACMPKAVARSLAASLPHRSAAPLTLRPEVSALSSAPPARLPASAASAVAAAAAVGRAAGSSAQQAAIRRANAGGAPGAWLGRRPSVATAAASSCLAPGRSQVGHSVRVSSCLAPGASMWDIGLRSPPAWGQGQVVWDTRAAAARLLVLVV